MPEQVQGQMTDDHQVTKAEAAALKRPQPQDHLKPAAQREVEGDDTIAMTWEGFELTIPASIDDWNIDVLEAFETGKAVTAVRGLIGTKHYDDLKAHFRKEHDRPVKVKDIGDLMEKIAEAAGFDTSGE